MKSSKANRRKKERRMPKMPELPNLSFDPAVLRMPAAIAIVLLFAFATKEALDQPVRTLVVKGQLERVTAVQVEGAIVEELRAGLFEVDFDSVREKVEALDWVDDVWVARRWPDRLVVQVSEHRAAARWGDNGLLNVKGELFTTNSRHPYPELPRLQGPEGAEQATATYYLALRNRLIEAGLTLETLTLDERGSLKFTLTTGQEIRVGRDDIDARIERFFAIVLPGLTPEMERIRHIDLRYTNGFAVNRYERPADESLLSMESVGRG